MQIKRIFVSKRTKVRIFGIFVLARAHQQLPKSTRHRSNMIRLRSNYDYKKFLYDYNYDYEFALSTVFTELNVNDNKTSELI